MEPTQLQPKPEPLTPILWTATITAVSDVDSSGSVIVTFDAQSSAGISYPNLSVAGDPGAIDSNIKVVLGNLQVANTAAATLQVGQEITL